MNTSRPFARSRLAALALVCAVLAVAGCSSTQITKRIDYKSTSDAPALEMPPELSEPRYDDRYTVNTASGLAAAKATAPKSTDLLPTNPDARVARAGNQRWIVARATPEQAWNISYRFWGDMGFVIAFEQPSIGVMETDWAENRADMPSDFLSKTVGKFVDAFASTYKRDKFRTRIERGAEAGTVEIYISHRGMEQIPTVKVDGVNSAGFTWALLPPDPNLEAEMLQRLMMRFGVPEMQAIAEVQAAAPSGSGAAAAPAPSDRARLEKNSDGTPKLVVDDPFDRAWRRVGLALDRSGFTVVDRDRSSGIYYVRYANPDLEMSKKDPGFIAKMMNFFNKDEKDKPEQYRIKVAENAPLSVVSVEDPNGAPDKTQNGEKILALLKDQLK